MKTNSINSNGSKPYSIDEVNDNYIHRNELMEEIISDQPDWFIRWGNVFFLICLILICFACWYIKYPDTIEATATLTSINTPKPVISLVSGKLLRLSVGEGQEVEEGKVVGFVESVAKHEDVLEVENLVRELDRHLVNEQLVDLPIIPDATLNLGLLQQPYQEFLFSYLTFNEFSKDGYYDKKRNVLLDEKKDLERLHKNLVDQSQLEKEKLALLSEENEINRSLNEDDVISDNEYRVKKNSFIQQKLMVPKIESSIVQNEIQQKANERELLDLEKTISQQKVVFKQAIHVFNSQIQDWKKKYVLVAPISGRVAFASYVQEKQQIETNETICYIKPPGSEYFVEALIPQSNFGKIEVGQKVLLKFESYPFQEYGSLIGRIEHINNIPQNDGGYLAKISLPKGLNTTYNKQIYYRDGLEGMAEIITNDLRLIERFYHRIIKLIRKKG